MKSFIIMILIFLAPMVANAQSITNVTEGDTVPFSGILLDARAFAELESSANVSEEKIKLEVDTKLKLGTLQLKLEKTLLQNEINYLKDLNELQAKSRNIDIEFWRGLYLEQADQGFFDRNRAEIGFIAGTIMTVLVFITVDTLDDKVIER